MPSTEPLTLKSSLIAAGRLSSRFCGGAGLSASWGELAAGSLPLERVASLAGRSVLVSTVERLASAAALIQLDGLARRIVLCPAGLSQETLSFVADVAEADALVTDTAASEPGDWQARPDRHPAGEDAERDLNREVSADPRLRWERFLLRPSISSDSTDQPVESPHVRNSTEWILLTSGTTGRPKLVRHTLESLSGAIDRNTPAPESVVWATFYDILRYGGLQIFLRAALTGTPLVVPGSTEAVDEFLCRAGTQRVTHISGTPSHWRRALSSPSAGRLAPEYVRLSGEIADQGILNQLKSQYPEARVAHAFASTEAGVAFAVDDGCAGFAEAVLTQTPRVEMKVDAGTLRVRSDRTACGYLSTRGSGSSNREGGDLEGRANLESQNVKGQALGDEALPLRDAEGFVDTGDAVELRAGRYYFVGRIDGTINVGGLKVHPEEVEMVINRHPEVGMSLVRAKKSPIMGTLVVADVVLTAGNRASSAQSVQRDILQFCRGQLAPYKVPAVINIVAGLGIAETGKLVRQHA